MIWLVVALIIFSTIVNSLTVKEMQSRLNVYENGLHEALIEIDELKQKSSKN